MNNGPRMGGMGGDPRISIAMQLVGQFQGSPDPFTSAAQFVYALGASGAGAYAAYSSQNPVASYGGGGFGGGGIKRPRGGIPQAGEGGNWACQCGNVNFAFRTLCNKCEAPRAE